MELFPEIRCGGERQAKRFLPEFGKFWPPYGQYGRGCRLEWFWGRNTVCVPDRVSKREAELVERFAQGDECAFLDIYDRFSKPVYRFLVYMCGSIAMAEEITQEVFVCLLNGKTFDAEKGNLEGYLIGIARNLARMEARRNARFVSMQGTSVSADLLKRISVDEQVLPKLLRDSDLVNLQAAILQLPLHYRETLVLCSLQGKSYEEAASVLGCSVGTIASRMSRAKSLLASLMNAPARSKDSRREGTRG